MTAETINLDWGNWSLGDLPELLERTTEILGPSAAVTTARLTPPVSGSLAHVELTAATVEDIDELRMQVEACEFIAFFDPDSNDERWSCSVAGLQITTELEVQS